MKKLVLLLAVVFSASLYSCGSSDKAADTAAVVEEVVAVEEVAVDSAAAPVDSAAAAVDSVAAAQ